MNIEQKARNIVSEAYSKRGLKKSTIQHILSGRLDDIVDIEVAKESLVQGAKAERDRLLKWAAHEFSAEGNYPGALVVHKLAIYFQALESKQ